MAAQQGVRVLQSPETDWILLHIVTHLLYELNSDLWDYALCRNVSIKKKRPDITLEERITLLPELECITIDVNTCLVLFHSIYVLTVKMAHCSVFTFSIKYCFKRIFFFFFFFFWEIHSDVYVQRMNTIKALQKTLTLIYFFWQCVRKVLIWQIFWGGELCSKLQHIAQVFLLLCPPPVCLLPAT